MSFKNVRDVGALGVISDIPSHSSPTNSWTDARNVAFSGSYIEKRGGFNNDTDTEHQPIELDMSEADIHEILPTLNESSGKLEGVNIYGGRHLWMKDSLDNYTLVDREGGDYTSSLSRPWRGTNFSNAAVMVNPSDVPQSKTTHQTDFQDLQAWGKSTAGGFDSDFYWRTPRIVAYKNFLVAISMVEGHDLNDNVYFPQRIRWSDISDVGGLPNSWDAADITRSAGYIDLTDATGAFSEAVPLRDSLVLYSSEEVFQMDFIGGNAIFSFRKIFDDLGTLNAHSVGVFESKHVIISQNDIRIHDGTTHQSIAENRVRSRIFGEIKAAGSEDDVRLKVRSNKSEIWICYRSDRSVDKGRQDTAAVWDWQRDTWSFVDLPNTLTIQEVPDSGTDGKDSWSDMTGPDDTWGGLTVADRQWATLAKLSGNGIMTGYSEHGSILRLTEGISSQVSGRSEFGELQIQPLKVLLRRDGLDFDRDVTAVLGENAYLPLNSFKKVKGLYPQFMGTGVIKIEVSGRNLPNDQPQYIQDYFYDIERDYKADFRINSRYFSLSFTETSNTTWKFTDYDIEFMVGGVK